MDHADNAQLVYSVVILVALVIGYFTSQRHSNAPTIQYALTWIGIFFVLVIAYSFKERIMGELVPSRAISEQGQLVIRQSKDNHFYIDILVNGKQINFLVDTGASDIVLNTNDAVAVGLDLNRLKFNKIYNTANGQVRGASARVGRMQIDKVIFNDVPVSVNEGELNVSLLGMSFLDRFQSFKIDGERLYLEY
jgi:aspartyl protease family protein